MVQPAELPRSAQDGECSGGGAATQRSVGQFADQVVCQAQLADGCGMHLSALHREGNQLAPWDAQPSLCQSKAQLQRVQAQSRPHALEARPLAEPAAPRHAKQGCAAMLDGSSAPAGALPGATPTGREEEAPPGALGLAYSQEPAVQATQQPAGQAQVSDKAQQAGAGGAYVRSSAAEPARPPAAPAAGGKRAEQAALQPGDEGRLRAQGPAEGSLQGTPLLRRMASMADAEAALDAWLAERPGSAGPSGAACAELLQAALERGNAGLALSVHAVMGAARPAASLASGGGAWPPVTLDSMTALVRASAMLPRL